MSRISDASSINSLINTMLRTEQRREEVNFQVVSGKISPDYAGIARDSERLVNLETTRDLNNQFISNNETAQLRLDVGTQVLDHSQTAIKDMREAINAFLGRGAFDEQSVGELQKFAFANLQNLEAFLNTDVDGQFLFAGSRTDQRPVDLDLTTLENFQQKYDGATNQYATTRDAHMVQLSNSQDTNNLNKDYIDASNWLVFRRDDDGDATTTGTSSIEATSAMFTDYEPGGRITVTGSGSNNGDYTVDSVSSDGTKIFVSTEMLTDEDMPLGLTTESVISTAQVDTATLVGTVEATDTYAVTVDGTTVTYTVTGGEADIDAIRDGLLAAINLDATVSAVVTASAGTGTGELVLTGDTTGVSFTATSLATDVGGGFVDNTSTIGTTTAASGAVAQIDSLTFGGTFEAGDVFNVNVDGTAISYTVVGGDTDMDGVRTSIAAAINANATISALVTASNGAGTGELILTANDPGVGFTTTSYATDSGTIDATTTLSTTRANDGGVIVTLPDATQLSNADTGGVALDRAAGTISAGTADAFLNVSVGDVVNISGDAQSNGSYTVTAIDANSQVLTVTAGASISLEDGTVVDASNTDRMVFNRDGDTITSDRVAFTDFAVGDKITVDGTLKNNGAYTVASVSADGKSITVEATKLTDEGSTSGTTFFEYNVGTRFRFEATADTLQAQDISGNAITGAFSDLQVGDSIVVTGTDTNQIDTVTMAGSVEAGDVYSVTIDGNTVSYTTTGGEADIDAIRDALFAAVNADGTVNTIVTASAGASGEMLITADVANTPFTMTTTATNGGSTTDNTATTVTSTNDNTYTIGSISSDGSTITMAGTTPVGTDQTVSTGAGVAASARGFVLRTGNEIIFDDANDTITLQDISSSAATQDIFDNLQVGMEFTISGTSSNDGTFTVASISADGSSITVDEDITIAETFDPSTSLSQVSIEVFAADGTVASSQSYYGGDDFIMSHRVDESRTIDWDVNAGHPAFEKAIRAMSILAQGGFGSEGGLDQNQERIANALYMLNDALESPADGTPPYGAELHGDLNEILFELGFKQVVLHETINNQTDFNGLLDSFISETEDADQLEAITRLMDEQRSLEASYQALSRVFSLNLADFL
jgi:hypothetical protein